MAKKKRKTQQIMLDIKCSLILKIDEDLDDFKEAVAMLAETKDIDLINQILDGEYEIEDITDHEVKIAGAWNG